MANPKVQAVVGPRIPSDEPPRRRWRYVLPSALFILAASVVVASFFESYWHMTLHAPQYPRGLHLQAYLTHLEGDVQEIDGLNHYIGMRPLGDAAHIEKALAFPAILVSALLLVAAVFIHTKWAALFALPALLFPVFFLADLQFWLWYFGQNLDPTAALSSSVKPFTPPVLGEGTVGNFRTTASAGVGLYMATAASVVILIGLYFHRRAYKPLVDAQQDASAGGGSGGSAEGASDPGRSPGASGHDAGEAKRQQSSESRARRVTTPSVIRGRWRLIQSAVLLLAFGGQVAHAETFDLNGAIDSAHDGATIHVPKGTYSGPVVVDRSVTLIADGRVVLDGGGDGTVLTVTAPDVTVRGFIVQNSGSNLQQEHTGILVRAPRTTIEDNVVRDTLFGITLKQSPESVVRGNTVSGQDLHIARRGDGIRLWASPDTRIENNTVHDTRDVVMWYSDRVRITGNSIEHNRYGLHFMYSHENVLEGNHLERNSVGAFLMYSRNIEVRRNRFVRNRGPSGYGLGLKDMQGVIVEDNVFAGNRVAVYIDNPPVRLPERDRYTGNMFAGNDVGVAFQPSVRNTAFSNNAFVENIQQVAVWGGGELRDNSFTVDGRGNYWSDYRGYDSTGVGIGDIPYRAEYLWDSLMDREPGLRLFIHSPAQRAVELAAKAFPIVRPRPLLTDEAPLMKPVRVPVPGPEPAHPWPLWALAGGLVGMVAVTLLAARPVTARPSSTEAATTSHQTETGRSDSAAHTEGTRR